MWDAAEVSAAPVTVVVGTSTVGAGEETGVGSGEVFEELPEYVDETAVLGEEELDDVVVVEPEAVPEAASLDDDEVEEAVEDVLSVVGKTTVVPLEVTVVPKLEEDELELPSVDDRVDEDDEYVEPVPRGTDGQFGLETPVLRGT